MQTHSQVANQSRAQAKTSTTAAGSFFPKGPNPNACCVLAFTSTLRNKKKKERKREVGQTGCLVELVEVRSFFFSLL